jgi:DUF2884 family protein
MRLTTVAVACALGLASLPVVAHGIHVDNDGCGVDYKTAYDVSVARNGIDFTRADGTPVKVFMHDGRLTVDGRDVRVSDADAHRLRDYEGAVRALVPEIAAIAREGIDIGYSAMTTVAATFVQDGDARRSMLAKLERNHARALARLDESIGAGRWRQHEVDDLVESVVGDSVSEVVGSVTGDAVSAALSGDSAKIAGLEARANSLDKAIDHEVNKRADKLGDRARALCPRLADLDHLQKTWAIRLADGSPLVLMTATPTTKKNLADN